MTTPTPTPQEENSPQAPATETPRTTGFFNRVQRQLNAEPMHPSEEKEIVVDMTPTIKATAPDE
ncbi:hypothetical protein QUB56_34795 [Microcoleus sp. AR_TQ3_B6]|uniref:hypothetical protein n=1 Tax=Microcoleus sp. AR_TQ3_B6 TaxID=3055284 RepID=UPI002FD55236